MNSLNEFNKIQLENKETRHEFIELNDKIDSMIEIYDKENCLKRFLALKEIKEASIKEYKISMDKYVRFSFK